VTTQEQGHRAPVHASRPARGAAALELHPPSVVIVTLRGEHDLDTKAELVAALAQASEHPKVLVDLCDCAFIDSAAVSVLIAASQTLTERAGRLELVIPPEARAVHRAAELTGLAAFLPIHATRGAGLASIQADS
jgi:anti-anti-sigma factor